MYNVIMRGPLGRNRFEYVKNFRWLFIDNTGYSAMPLRPATQMSELLMAGNTISMLVCATTVAALFNRVSMTDFEVISVTPQRLAA